MARISHAGGRVASGILLTRDALLGGEELIVDARLVREDLVIDFPGLQRIRGDSALGGFQYAPVLFTANRRPTRIERAVLEVLALLLEDVQGAVPRLGVLYSAAGGKGTRVHFSAGLKTGRDLLQSLQELQRREVQPNLVLNEHCPTCEFSTRCHEQAVREDSISLLRGLGRKAIAAYSRRGILTLTRLAHTFRPSS